MQKGQNKLSAAMIGHKRVPSREGGIEVVVEELSKRMIRHGISVAIYNRRSEHVAGEAFHSDEQLEGAVTYHVPAPECSALNAPVSSLCATIEACVRGYDVIHIHAEGPALMCFLPRLLNIPVVVTIHGLDWKRAKWGRLAKTYLKLGEWMAARCADEIIVLSRSDQEYFRETYGRKTRYIPNGVTEPVRREASLITERYGLAKGDYILYLGRLVPEKGVDLLIRAYQELQPEEKLVIAGGFTGETEYEKSLKALAGGSPDILFTGFVEGELYEELLTNARCYVLPSFVEGMPLSLMEAMSYDLPCLASSLETNASVMGGWGRTFTVGQESDLKDQLETLLRETEPESTRKQRGEWIRRKFSWDKITDVTLRVYERAMRRKKKK